MRPRIVAAAAGAALVALAAQSCLDDLAGPRHPFTGYFSVAPLFPSAAGIVPLAQARITLHRPDDSGFAVDTVVSIPPGDTAVDLSVSVPMFTSSETFILNVYLITPAGDTAFHGGPTTVTPVTGGTGALVNVTFAYVGVGFLAADVVIVTPDTSLFFQDTLLTTAQAVDSGGAPIPGTPIAWGSLDPLRASVPNPAVGKVAGGLQRGVARITATLLTGQADTLPVLVQPIPSALLVASGGGQTGTVDQALAQPVVAQVNGTDGLGVEGVTVTFAPAGGGVVSPLAGVTDAAGQAAFTWTLGPVAGAQTAAITVAGFPTVQTTVSATAVAGPVASVVVAPASASLTALGATQAFTAQAFDANANPIPGAVFTWSSADPLIATVDPATGLATAVGVGTVAISATTDGITGNAALAIAQTITAIVVTPPSATLDALGVTQQFNAEARDANDNPLVTQPTFTWASGNDLIATVDPATGLAAAVANGMVAISATAGGVTGTATLSIVQAIASIVVAPPNAILDALGLTQAFSAQALDGNGQPLATQPAFTWASSDDLIATVDPGTGVATAVANGSVTISAAAGGVIGTATLSITQMLASIVVTPPSATLDALGLTQQFGAQALDANSQPLATQPTFTWATSDALIATVDPLTGLATAVANGSVTISATAGGVTGSGTLTIGEIVASIVVTPSTFTAATLGNTQQFTAQAFDLLGTSLSLQPSFAWSSSATGVATVDPATGLAAAVGNGTATITAAASGVSGSADVTVSQVAADLMFLVQPTDAIAGAIITPAVEVAARDSAGNVATNFGNDVNLIRSDFIDCLAALSGTTTVAALGGVATFGDLFFEQACPAMQLRATSGPLPPAQSVPFNVTAAAADTIFAIAGDGQTATVGSLLATPLSIKVTDAFGNGVAGVIVSWTVTQGGGALSQPVDTTDGSGFSSVQWTLGGMVGAQLVEASAVGLKGSPVPFSATATVGPAAQLGFVQQPTTTLALDTITPAVQVAVQDAFGNVVTTATDAVSLATGTNPAGGTLLGTTTRSALNGIATFGDLSVDNLGVGYTLEASSGTLTSTTSAPFDILAPAAAVVWTNLAGGNWSNPANWSSGAVPSVTDTIYINQGGTYTVTLDVDTTVAEVIVGGTSGTQTLAITARRLTVTGNSLTVGPNGVLAFGGGTINGLGTVTIDGQLQWTGGTIADAGLIQITTGAAATLGGAATKTLNGRQFRNAGTLAWSSGALSLGNGAALINETTGSVDLQADVSTATFGTPALITNAGSLTKSAGAGTSSITAPLDNTGSVSVQSGTLQLSGNGSHTGPFTVATGATLRLAGGTHTIGGDVTGLGAGVFAGASATVNGTYTLPSTVLTSGSATFTGPFGVTDSIAVTTATVTFNTGGPIATPRLVQAGGTLGGSDSVVVSGTFAWTGGTQSGTGVTHLPSGVTTTLSTTTTKTVNGRRLRNAGSLAWSSGALSLGNGAALINETTGSVDLQADVSTATFGTPALITNAGSLTKSAGAGTSSITAPLDNTGSVSVQSGTLQLSGNGSHTGPFTVATGATLRLAGGTHTIGGDVTGLGAGVFAGATATVNGTYSLPSVVLTSGSATFTGPFGVTDSIAVTNATVTFATSGPIITPRLVQAGGALGGSDSVVVSGTFAWTGGTQSGTGVTHLLSAATTTLGTTTTKTVNGRRLRNAGSLAWGGGALSLGNGAALINEATGSVDLQADVSTATFGTPALITNAGSLTKSAGAGTSSITAPLDNTGSVSVQSGTLQLSGNGSHTGPFTVATGTTLRFAGGTHAAGGNVSGAGTGLFTGATATLSGAYGLANAVITAGSVTFNGSFSVTDSVAIVGGAAAFATGGPITTPRLRLASGTLSGTDSLTATGSFSWEGGTQSGSGVTVLAAGAAGTLSSPSTKTLDARRLRNAGTLAWTSGALSLGNAASVINEAGGVFDIQGDLVTATFGTSPTMANAGLFLKTAGAGPAVINVALTNRDTLVAQTGTLQLARGIVNEVAGIVQGSGAIEVPTGQTLSNSGSITNALVRIGGTLTSPGTFSPVTTEFFGGGQTIPSRLAYQNVTVTGIASVGGAATLNGNLLVSGSGSLTINGQQLTVGGDLTTADLGTITMNNVADTVTVQGSATFAGGPESGLLGNGLLRIAGNFTQLVGGSAGSFEGASLHVTEFSGAALQTVSFQDPVASHFGNVRIAHGSGGAVSFVTDAFAAGQLQTPASAGGLFRTILGNGRTLRVLGLDADSLVLDNLPLSVDDGFNIDRFNAVTFTKYATTVTQLQLTRTSGVHAFASLRFDTVPTTGLYLDLKDQDGTPLTLFQVTMEQPFPTTHSGFARTDNVAVLLGWLP